MSNEKISKETRAYNRVCRLAIEQIGDALENVEKEPVIFMTKVVGWVDLALDSV